MNNIILNLFCLGRDFYFFSHRSCGGLNLASQEKRRGTFREGNKWMDHLSFGWFPWEAEGTGALGIVCTGHLLLCVLDTCYCVYRTLGTCVYWVLGTVCKRHLGLCVQHTWYCVYRALGTCVYRAFGTVCTVYLVLCVQGTYYLWI